ncbi:hypothetical protein [Halalkalibacter akibai]|uniref:HEAT repeat domain-containing protein n=1 Tax=Halalkalibacter akibai (strain ATCC 43226 / DSM 21942 / CIP 109018 / JCM 9157 / 1139) TaxID=1236973 RepID=W4QVN1_HALA3|nr:hypothetical protein [Halalkalibacter akibai]GAE36215.1 hypothetical protein JCM9157_3373 [Halalkalibacter akibai JCM 9157]
MNTMIKQCFANLESKNKEEQYQAYTEIMKATDQEVDWAYDVWDQLKRDLTDRDHHRRSRAAQFLSQLAISDPEKRMLEDYEAVWQVTFDEKFVTARHSLQSFWKIGLASQLQLELVLNKLTERFLSCEDEKNYTLIRYDIVESLKKLYEHLNVEDVKTKALQLIEQEEDAKYKKKYAKVWK